MLVGHAVQEGELHFIGPEGVTKVETPGVAKEHKLQRCSSSPNPWITPTGACQTKRALERLGCTPRGGPVEPLQGPSPEAELVVQQDPCLSTCYKL